MGLRPHHGLYFAHLRFHAPADTRCNRRACAFATTPVGVAPFRRSVHEASRAGDARAGGARAGDARAGDAAVNDVSSVSPTRPLARLLGDAPFAQCKYFGQARGESWPSAGRCQCQCVRSGAVDRHWRVCNLAAGRGGAAQLDGQRAPKLLSSFVFRRHWRVMNG